jgi:dipeptidyl aminopeptidase/acylaminoacyl peptidase
MRNHPILWIAAVVCLSSLSFSQEKPKLTLDEFFNAVYFRDVRIAPDGNAVAFVTERADWDKDRFRDDIWLYRVNGGTLSPLTQTGHDSSPQWSPDGQWIAFLSDRSDDNSTAKESDDDKDKDKQIEHV